MSTKSLLPLALLASVVVAFFAAFYVRSPELQANVDAAVRSYEEADAPLADIESHATSIAERYASLEEAAAATGENLTSLHLLLTSLKESSDTERSFDAQQQEAVEALVQVSKQHNQDTEDVLATVLSNMLGEPIGQSFGERSVVKVYSLKEAGYRGYLAKVKLNDPSAMKLVLSNDKLGDKGETTSSAAKRTGAVLAINAGGFSRDKSGLLYPMGVTVIDGEIVAFYQTGLSFIGIDKDGKLVGGDIETRQDVEAMNVQYGATFVPTLLKDGKKQTIPNQWKNKREPRTMIGHFSNGDLLFIVIDGRQKGYSNGVTLEEAQTKLLEWNVRDAYNLDGGGSSAFVYDGKVLNSPSDGRERNVVSNFVVLP